MKIKTKRGARRIRNQRVINRRYVLTYYAGCSYVTSGKKYLLISDLEIFSDDGFVITAPTEKNSSHFDFKAKWHHPVK